MRRIVLVFLLAAACKPTRPSDLAAVDVEIERAILWEYRNDRRFDGVLVACRDRKVTLSGRVESKAAADEALARARKAASSAEVRSVIEIRER